MAKSSRESIREQFDHTLECPACHATVKTVPAEGVPDQLLRGCPVCDHVWFQEIEQP